MARALTIIGALVVLASADALAQLGVLTGRDLSRDAALRLLNQYEPFRTVASVTLAGEPTTVEGGTAEGLWARRGIGELVLTDEGRKHFARIDGQYSYSAIPAAPITRSAVAITGIADFPLGPGLKEVQFQWRYGNIDPVVARYTGQGSNPHSSSALFRRYDDGWRVERVEPTESARVPFRRDAARATAAANARADVAALERAAKTPTRKIASGELLACPHPKGSQAGEQRTQIEVTDTNVTIKRSGGSGRVGTLGYWEIPNITISRANVQCGFRGSSPGLSIRIGDVQANATESAAAAATLVETIREAHRAWNDTFPDKTTWRRSGAGSQNRTAQAMSGDARAVALRWVNALLGRDRATFLSLSDELFNWDRKSIRSMDDLTEEYDALPPIRAKVTASRAELVDQADLNPGFAQMLQCERPATVVNVWINADQMALCVKDGKVLGFLD